MTRSSLFATRDKILAHLKRARLVNLRLYFVLLLKRNLEVGDFARTLVLCLVVSCLVAGDAFAITCSGESTDPSVCQAIAESNTVAPSVSQSMGIRLNPNTTNVLFNNSYSGGASTPYFISNTGSQSYFIPQGNKGDYDAFILALQNKALNGAVCNGAVVPSSYTAKPKAYSQCVLLPGTSLVSLPFSTATYKSNPNGPTTAAVIVSAASGSYTALDAVNLGASQNLTTIGTVVFNQTRTDCSRDDEGNSPPCNVALFTDTQTLTFAATGANYQLAWAQTPTPVDALTLSLNGGASNSATDCSTRATEIYGACGWNDGQDLASQPTDGLCSSGDAAGVSATNVSGFGLKWGWTCYDVQGTITGVANNRLASGLGCGACQLDAKQTISDCTANGQRVTCGGGSQTVTNYDGCGNAENSHSQSCNTQACCYPRGSKQVGACDATCGTGQRDFQWYDTCGVAETTAGSSGREACDSGRACQCGSASYSTTCANYSYSAATYTSAGVNKGGSYSCGSGKTLTYVMAGVYNGNAYYNAECQSCVQYQLVNNALCEGYSVAAAQCPSGRYWANMGSYYTCYAQ